MQPSRKRRHFNTSVAKEKKGSVRMGARNKERES